MGERESLVGKMRKWLVTRIDQRMAEKIKRQKEVAAEIAHFDAQSSTGTHYKLVFPESGFTGIHIEQEVPLEAVLENEGCEFEREYCAGGNAKVIFKKGRTGNVRTR